MGISTKTKSVKADPTLHDEVTPLDDVGDGATTVPGEFPKMLYGRGGTQLTVNDAAAQAKAGEAWHESPDEV